MAASKKPAHEIKVGLIRATIWENHGEKGRFYAVQLSRRFKQGDDWKTSTSFSGGDLVNVVRATVLAEAWIYEQTGSGEPGA